MIHHSNEKKIYFYELNAQFGNYEVSHMKWVLDWGGGGGGGVTTFYGTFFSVTLITIFFYYEVGWNIHNKFGCY